MKNQTKVVKTIIIFLLVVTFVLHDNVVYASANDNQVSTRELAMLASLVYEDVPDDNRYDGDTAELGCYNKSGNKKSGRCFYTALEGKTSSNLKLKGSKYNIWQYIEGLSERKMNSAVSFMTAAFQEDGQKYYFLNFADTSEMSGWDIVNSKSNRTSSLKNKPVDLDWDGVFDAITFKKRNNYVIAFRGTDYPDLYEWFQDVAYALNGEHKQAKLAYQYAQSEYDRIIKENKNANIYVTGHSLGGYLAQVGGAAIIDKEAGITNSDRTATDYTDFDDYSKTYSKSSNLIQVAYFNGMGVGGIFSTNNFTKNIDNALIYLSTHNKDGSRASTKRLVNYSSDKTKIGSSGRLVLYSLDADPISDIGIHYGEIYKLEVAADAINNHHKTHSSGLGDGLSLFFRGIGKIIKQNDIKALEKENDNKFISSISENLYNMIDGNEALSEKYNFIPNSVSNTISKENNNIPIVNYEITSVLANLSKDVERFSTKYKNIEITNLFDHFNMNHETDSFTCLIDKDYGKITKDKINLTVSKSDSNHMKCDNKNSTCYTNRQYSVSGKYTFGSNIITNKYNNIVITASVNGGCANSYTWYYSLDGTNFKELGTTVIKQIIVPRNIIKVEKNSNQKLYFKVKINYGNEYTETKLKASSNSVNFRYEKEAKSSVNPTIINDEINSSNGSVMSNILEVNYVYDTNPPTCSFTTSKLSIIRGDSKNLVLECDDASPITFDSSNINLSFALKDGFTYTTSCDNYNKLCNINVKANPYKPFSFPANSQTLSYDKMISDYAGNYAKVKNKVSLKRVKQ